MNTRYKSKTAEWVRRAVLAVLLAVLLFALGRCIYRNRTVAEMNEYVTAFAYKGETYTYIEPACGYVQGTQIGKTQNGYWLFRVEGDDGERQNVCFGRQCVCQHLYGKQPKPALADLQDRQNTGKK